MDILLDKISVRGRSVAYSDQSVLRFKFLRSVQRVIDQPKACRLAASKLQHRKLLI